MASIGIGFLLLQIKCNFGYAIRFFIMFRMEKN